MRDIAWSLFDRAFPVLCFVGGAWFQSRTTRTGKDRPRA